MTDCPVSFLLVGDGYAARQIATAIGSMAGARLAAVASTAAPAGGRLTLPGGRDTTCVTTSFIIGDAGIAWARALGVDWLLCINSTTVLPLPLIEMFDGRALNCHPGPLPEYAGLHAHQWAIRNGETEYGATVHRMEAKVDAGPVVASVRFPIRDEDTGLSLFRRTIAECVTLLIMVIGHILARKALIFISQDLSRRRVYRHCDALDGRIDWRLAARAVVDFVRAGNYEPFRSPTYVASTRLPSGALIEVLRCEPAGQPLFRGGSLITLERRGPVIACGDGHAVRITHARSQGRAIGFAEWQQHLGTVDFAAIESAFPNLC